MVQQERAGQRRYLVPIVLLIFVLLVGGAYLYLGRFPRPDGLDGRSASEEPPEAKKLKEEAFAFQEKKKWCQAEEKWDEVLKVDRPKDSLSRGGWRLEAERNRDIVRELCKITRDGVSSVQLLPEDRLPEDRPPEITAGELLKYYPKGRSTRTGAWTTITGKGVNRNWGIRGEAHFLYIYQVAGQILIEENNGKELQCLVHLSDVSQTLAFSKEKFEIDWPDQPLVRVIWKNMEEHGLLMVPWYVAAKKTGQVLSGLDPNSTKALSHIVPLLRKAGIGPEKGAEIDLLSQIEGISGLKVRVTYVNGMGVMRIEVIDGPTEKKFDREALLKLAKTSSLLLDYHIFPGANKKVGDTWKVRAGDVADVLPFHGEAGISGSLTLSRNQDKQDEAILAVKAGDLTLANKRDDREESARVSVQNGTVAYSMKDLLIRRADLQFQAKTEFRSKDHLLFQTEKIRDLEIKARYEAERLDPAGRGGMRDEG